MAVTLVSSSGAPIYGVEGLLAHDAVDSGNPLKIGGKAAQATPTAVSAGDRTNAWYGLSGQAMVSLAMQNSTSGGDAAQYSKYIDSSATEMSGPMMGVALYGFDGVNSWSRARHILGVTAGANTDLGILAAGIGPGYQRIPAAGALTGSGQATTVSAAGGGSVSVDISGTFTATVAFEATMDGTNWFAFNLGRNDGGQETGTSTNARYWGDLHAVRSFRVRCSAYTSGTVVVAVTINPFTTGFISVPSGGVVGGDGNNGLQVQSSVAHDAVDAGNPLKIGGRASSTAPTAVATGDRVNAWLTPTGEQHVALGDGSSSAGADGATQAWLWAGGTNAPFGVTNYGFNGASYDRIRTLGAVDVAPNNDAGILAVGAGPGWDRKQDPGGISATSTASQVSIEVDGADAIVFTFTTIGVTPGSMIFEQSNDTGPPTYTTAGAVLKLGALESWVEGAFVPAVGDTYMVRTTGIRRIRIRVNAVYASGTVTVKWTAALGTAIVKTVEMPGAPHKIGYPLVGVSAQYTTAQTSTTIGPTVSSTQRLVVTYIQIQAGGTVAATQCSIYFGTGAFSRGTSKPIFDGEFAPSATLKPQFTASPPVPWMGAADEELKITNVGATNPLTVVIWYYLVAA